MSLLGVLSLCGAVAPAQANAADLIYQAHPSPRSISLCIGEIKEIEVYIQRTTDVNGATYVSRTSGGRITGLIDDLDVAHFDPVGPSRAVGAPPASVATFELVADSPGTTEISFVVSSTGEEARVGGQWRRLTSDPVDVEVTECFEAYTSGLATIFTQSWMDKLRDPFFLEGHVAGSTVAGATQSMLFIPNPQNRTTGGYAFIDTYWPLTGTQGRCTAYISGDYDVVFYPDEEHVVEGDLLMMGTGVVVCPRLTLPIDYRSAPGFQIGFRPRATGP